MKTKVKYSLIAIIILVGILIICNLTALSCSALAPQLNEDVKGAVDEIEGTELTFWKKAIIGKDKYGYREKISFDEPVVISQYVVEDSELENVYYGIYKDKNLENPVHEIDLNYQLKAEAELEEGADSESYPDYEKGFGLKLEPGTYYVAVYTTSLFETDTVEFVTKYGTLEDTVEVAQNQETPWYFAENEAREIYFQVKPQQSGQVTMNLAYAPEIKSVQLCNDQKEPMQKLNPSKASKGMDVSFDVEADETYFVHVEFQPGDWGIDTSRATVVYASTVTYAYE